jgi:hypothetical protein
MPWLDARPALARLLVLEDGRVLRSRRMDAYLDKTSLPVRVALEAAQPVSATSPIPESLDFLGLPVGRPAQRGVLREISARYPSSRQLDGLFGGRTLCESLVLHLIVAFLSPEHKTPHCGGKVCAKRIVALGSCAEEILGGRIGEVVSAFQYSQSVETSNQAQRAYAEYPMRT